MRSDLEKTLLSKIYHLPSLKGAVAAWQNAGERVVFTNGVFDLLHIGHITYLAKAAELGDKLVIGLNSDSSVKPTWIFCRVWGGDNSGLSRNTHQPGKGRINGGRLHIICFYDRERLMYLRC